MNIEMLMNSPEDFYDTPGDVLRDDQLSEKEKQQILKSWKNQSEHLSESESEGLPSRNKTTRLEDINKALMKLAEHFTITDHEAFYWKPQG
ncbi:MAG: hypothetical protein CME62_06800 [Halobacteriovoraceae bacterium]|nr:hypothetical protein [Halobacteriovoraceae bacterium]|tara:strand:- start:551 stop:823 length:273 start_codon:yes stop_codon:yes gene_type:complete